MFARSLLDVSYVTAVRWSALPSGEETVSEDYVATSASSATCAALRRRLSSQQSVSRYVTAERGWECWEGGTWSQGIIGSVAEPPTFWASAPWSFICEKVRKNTAHKLNLFFFSFFLRFMNKYFQSIKHFVELQCGFNYYFPVPGPFEALNSHTLPPKTPFCHSWLSAPRVTQGLDRGRKIHRRIK